LWGGCPTIKNSCAFAKDYDISKKILRLKLINKFVGMLPYNKNFLRLDWVLI